MDRSSSATVMNGSLAISTAATSSTSSPLGVILGQENVDRAKMGCSVNSQYAWVLTGVLATLAFGCLIVKRYFEPPNHRRSWRIWFFDISKQAIGALVIHFFNVFLAELQFSASDPCTQYIISFLLDSSLGLLIIYLGIRLTQTIAIRRDYPYLIFGEYGKPPQLKFWGYQCLAYVLILSFSKLVISIVLLWRFWDSVRDFLLWVFALIPIPNLEVTLVVLVIPFVVNVFMFWITDNFLTMHRTEGSKMTKAIAVVRNCKLPFSRMLCCLRRHGIDGDNVNIVEIVGHDNGEVMTTSA